MEDQEGSADTGSTEQQADATGNEEDVQEEQVADTDESAESSEEEQPAEGSEDDDLPQQYRGKSKREIVRMHQEAEKLIGNRREVEDKARAYDQLSQAQRISGAPKWQEFTLEDGTLDAPAFEQATAQYYAMTSGETARQAAREEVDLDRIYRDFPYMKDDPDAADAAVSMYRSGRTKTLYEAAQRTDKLRNSQVSQAEKIGAQKKEKELVNKTRSFSERAGSKSNEAMTQEAFNKLSLEEKEAYVEKHWGNQPIG